MSCIRRAKEHGTETHAGKPTEVGPVFPSSRLRCNGRSSRAPGGREFAISLADAGRREPPPQLLTRARTLAGYPDETVLLPLPVLALMIGVHVRTLHAAARSGRLGVAYDTRTTFRRLRPRATLKHALDFRRHYYGTQRRPPATPVPLTWASVPEDYDVQLKALRRHLDISQAGLARMVGAAGKAVVYQWEARKRTPSPLFRLSLIRFGGRFSYAA